MILRESITFETNRVNKTFVEVSLHVIHFDFVVGTLGA